MSLSVTVLDEKQGLKPDAADRPAALLHTLTDLYVLKSSHSADEERQFTELAIRLIDAVDIPTRLLLAQRLERYGRAPQAVMRHLAGDVPVKAEPEDNAETPPASRDFAPVEPILPAVATTPGSRSVTAEPPARCQAEQSAADAAELIDLFFAADSAQRALILENIDFAPIPPAAPLHEVHAREAARRLEVAALERNAYEFATVLVGALGITQTLAVRIAQDSSGEPLIVAVRALGVPADILQRIVLFLNPAIGESVERVYDLVRLYEQITTETARRMLTLWRTAASARRPKPHRPYLHDDEQRRIRAQATMDARRFVAQGLERARRA